MTVCSVPSTLSLSLHRVCVLGTVSERHGPRETSRLGIQVLSAAPLCCPPQTLLKTGEQCWSLAELVQAVVLLAHCHSLCSFVFGSGTDGACDLSPLPKSPNGTPPASCPCDVANGNANVPDITQRQVTPLFLWSGRRVRPRWPFWIECC